MKRSWNVLLVAGLALMITAPAVMAQETIVGHYDGLTEGHNAGSGALSMTGWALADSGVARVVIQVDGIDIGQALYGRTRPQVESQYPGFPDSEEAGFAYNLNSTDFSNGTHWVGAKVITNDGNVHQLNTMEILFTNNTSILTPFGRIQTPQRNVTMAGSCSPLSPTRYSVIEGWALDLGVETGDAGIGWVELLIDGSIISNTRTGCFYNPLYGGLTNCYGLPHLAIERNYPFAIDAPNAGFRFVLDVGDLIAFAGYAEGHHTLTIRAGDISNQNANIDEMPVTFRCVEDLPNESSFGRIESPRIARQYSGVMEISGWALDWEGVSVVQVYVDGEFQGLAEYGEDTRPAVLADYPGYYDAEYPSFSFLFDTTTIADGFHSVQVFVRDRQGDRSLIHGEVTFLVDNDPGGSHPVDE